MSDARGVRSITAGLAPVAGDLAARLVTEAASDADSLPKSTADSLLQHTHAVRRRVVAEGIASAAR